MVIQLFLPHPTEARQIIQLLLYWPTSPISPPQPITQKQCWSFNKSDLFLRTQISALTFIPHWSSVCVFLPLLQPLSLSLLVWMEQTSVLRLWRGQMLALSTVKQWPGEVLYLWFFLKMIYHAVKFYIDPSNHYLQNKHTIYSIIYCCLMLILWWYNSNCAMSFP